MNMNLLPTLAVVLLMITTNLHQSSGLQFDSIPQDAIVVLGKNTTDIAMKWRFTLVKGESFFEIKCERLDSTDESKMALLYSSSSLKPNVITMNSSLYSASRDIKSGPSSGSFNFTIKNMVKQINNDDGSPYNPLSKDYLYRLTISVYTNTQQSKRSEVKAFVYAPPGAPTVQVDNTKYCLNTTISITCKARTGNPPNTTITFYRNSNKFKEMKIDAEAKATLNDISLDKDGVESFTCKAANLIGSSQNSTALNVEVKDPPAITKCANQTSNESDPLSWTCKTRGSQPVNYTWVRLKDNTIVSLAKAFDISSVYRSDTGKYRFTVSNGNECPTVSTTVYLTVQYLKTCVKKYDMTDNQCASIQSVGNPVPTLSCCPQGNLNVTQRKTDYSLCGVKGDTVNNCTVANEVGRCSFIVKLRKKVNEYVYNGSFKCSSCNYYKSLNDSSSADFKKLTSAMEGMFKSVFEFFKYVTTVQVLAFWPGSVIVDFQLKLIANVIDPLLPLKEAVRRSGGTLNGLEIDSISIKAGHYIPPTITPTSRATTTSTHPEEGTSTTTNTITTSKYSTDSPHTKEYTSTTTMMAATSKSPVVQCTPRTNTACTESSLVPAIVLGVILGISLLVNFILIGYFVWKHRKENKRGVANRVNNNDESGYMNAIALQDQPPSDSQDVVQYATVGDEREQESTNTAMYQSVKPHSDTYSSLSPSTKLAPKPAVITNSGVYQDIQGAPHQYQSLDTFSRV